MGSYLVAGTILSELEQSSISIVPSSLVGLTVGGVRWYRDAAARWRAHCARDLGVVVEREWATGRLKFESITGPFLYNMYSRGGNDKNTKHMFCPLGFLSLGIPRYILRYDGSKV